VYAIIWRYNMDYKIAPSIDGIFIILKIKGSINRETAMRLNLEAHALGKQLQVSRYLVDVTEARNTDTIMGNYKFAYSDMQKVEGIDKYAALLHLSVPTITHMISLRQLPETPG
jgi:hypothetical protein